MTETSDFRELLLNYKLRKLSAEDRERFDEQMIGRQEFSDRLAEAEYDLLDDYRSGRLTPAQALRVKQAFSPDELKHGRGATREDSTTSQPAEQRIGMRLARLAVAASILAVATGLLALYLHEQHSRSAHVNPQGPPALTHVPAPAPQIASTPPEGSSRSTEQMSGAFATLLLDPAIARGAVASVLELPRSVKAVRVQWVVPPALSAQTFSLSVTKSGAVLTTVSQHGGLQSAGGIRFAEFDIGADIFAPYPGNARFLFIVYAGGQQHNAVAEISTIVRKQ